MKMDPEVNIISKQAVQIMSKATVLIVNSDNMQTLVIDMMANKLNDRLKQDGTKTVKVIHLMFCYNLELSPYTNMLSNSFIAFSC